MFSASTSAEKRYLLVLGADILLRERAIVSALRAYPGPVFGMAQSPQGLNRFFDNVIQADYYNAKNALAAVELFGQETSMWPAAVVPIIEMTVHVSVALSRRYNLPSLSDRALALARDKHAMKEAFEAAGVPCARHRTFATLSELRNVATELAFPLVLKPRYFAGNTGTVKVNGPQELDAAFTHCRDQLLEVAPLYDFSDGLFQAEEFVPSTHEISVEVLNYGGQRRVLAVTDKAKLPAPHFTEIGQLVPSRESGNDAVRELGMAACAALDITRGIAHVEILVNRSDLSVVEVGARPGGDGIMDLIDRVYGFNPYDLHYATYLDTVGQLPEIPRQPRGIGAIRFLKARPGLITGIGFVGEVNPDELAVYITSQPGERSRAASSYLTRNGVIEFFRAGDPVDPVAFAEEVDKRASARAEELFSISEDGE